MEAIFPVLFLMFIGVIITVAVVAASAQKNSLNDAYRQLARQYGGQFHEGGWFDRPSVTFQRPSTWVRVDIYSTGGKNPTYYTQVHLAWPETHFRCEVYPEGIFNRIGKLLGMQDLEIGSPEFDRLYIIKGSSSRVLAEVLTAEVQAVIHQLRTLRGNNNVYVSFRGGELLVKKLGRITDLPTLDRLVRLSLELHAAALKHQQQGIEFIESDASEPAEAAICQICGDKIVTNLVFCRSCRTPHHYDCWTYYGACSTFGCGERRCFRPRQKKSSHRQE